MVNLQANLSRGGKHVWGRAGAEAGSKDAKIVIGSDGQRPPPPKEPEALTGKALPRLSDLGVTCDVAGKPVLVCFWNAQERPSRRTLRLLAERAAALAEKGVAVIAIQAEPIDEATLSRVTSRCAVTFPVASLNKHAKDMCFAWGVTALPWLVLADKTHQVRAEGFTIEELDAKVDALAKP